MSLNVEAVFSEAPAERINALRDFFESLALPDNRLDRDTLVSSLTRSRLVPNCSKTCSSMTRSIDGGYNCSSPRTMRFASSPGSASSHRTGTIMAAHRGRGPSPPARCTSPTALRITSAFVTVTTSRATMARLVPNTCTT